MKKNNLLTILAIGLFVFVFVAFFVSSFKKGSEMVNKEVDLLTFTLVEDYIENNIYNLSSEEAVLGGSFYVDSVRVLNNNMGVVDFEDGHMAYRAEFNFDIDNGEVSIYNFNILNDEREKTNFSKTGNLIFRNNNWSFVYEEPGKPALSSFVKFDKLSKCIDNNDIVDCSYDILENGDRVTINGFNEANNLLIYTLKFEFEENN
ncbi:hypothetical protein EOL94_02065 [bacterium]|nr:hypothetical protein [bacterium]